MRIQPAKIIIWILYLTYRDSSIYETIVFQKQLQWVKLHKSYIRKYSIESFLIPYKSDSGRCAEEVAWLGQIFPSSLKFLHQPPNTLPPSLNLLLSNSQQAISIKASAINWNLSKLADCIKMK